MAQSIGMLVDRFVFGLSSNKKELPIMYKLSKVWHELVPTQYVHLTRPLRLVPASSGNSLYVLLVGVHNNAVGSQFYYLKTEIISKICIYFGREIVTDIKIILKPMTLPATPRLHVDADMQLREPKILDQINDAELRQSLQLLYCSLPPGS